MITGQCCCRGAGAEKTGLKLRESGFLAFGRFLQDEAVMAQSHESKSCKLTNQSAGSGCC